MLTIRLARTGRENLQVFRLVVQEKTKSPKSGKILDNVGNYNPRDAENKLVFDAEKIEQFLKNGATLSDTVARLLLKNGFKKELVTKFIAKYTKQKPRKEIAEEPKKAEVKVETKPVEEAKVEEKPAEEAPKPKEEVKPTEEPKKEE
jgi:small subunit ribosomal protein S16